MSKQKAHLLCATNGPFIDFEYVRALTLNERRLVRERNASALLSWTPSPEVLAEVGHWRGEVQECALRLDSGDHRVAVRPLSRALRLWAGEVYSSIEGAETWVRAHRQKELVGVQAFERLYQSGSGKQTVVHSELVALVKGLRHASIHDSPSWPVGGMWGPNSPRPGQGGSAILHRGTFGHSFPRLDGWAQEIWDAGPETLDVLSMVDLVTTYLIDIHGRLAASLLDEVQADTVLLKAMLDTAGPAQEVWADVGNQRIWMQGFRTRMDEWQRFALNPPPNDPIPPTLADVAVL